MKTAASSSIVVSLLFALAIIGAAFALKGTPAAEWVETALVGAALCFVVFRRPVCRP